MSESIRACLRVTLYNRTITCSKCGRLDMVTTESFADMKDIVESQGWRICRIVSDYEARGLCPDCKEAVQ